MMIKFIVHNVISELYMILELRITITEYAELPLITTLNQSMSVWRGKLRQRTTLRQGSLNWATAVWQTWGNGQFQSIDKCSWSTLAVALGSKISWSIRGAKNSAPTMGPCGHKLLCSPKSTHAIRQWNKGRYQSWGLISSLTFCI